MATTDPKASICVEFILELLAKPRQEWEESSKSIPPLFVGLNGLQGIGKSTLVSLVQSILQRDHHLSALVLSIDDLYLPHKAQSELAKAYPHNALIRHRGQPGTHDVPLGVRLFADIHRRNRNIKIPSYDKSAFKGQGDRRPSNEWQVINDDGQSSVDVVIFEGWCVGYRPLSTAELLSRWKTAQQDMHQSPDTYIGQLGRTAFTDIAFVNEQLKTYDILTDRLQALIHLDAENISDVYTWRLQQELDMWASRGCGMLKKDVIAFVNCYYPAYELYLEPLRRGMAGLQVGRQIRLSLSAERTLIKAERF